MEEYQLICMASDGDYVYDYKGSIEECNNASCNIGSKWYFYPWHLILTEKGIVEKAFGIVIDKKSNEAILNKIFKGELSLAISIFKDNYHKKFLHQLISSQLDMDRLDYLRRDSFYTGISESA